ncbi:MAG TPA: hypothetical protein VKP30_02535 [Polyangiaceae bacterium]|nr:hypothetical protein [Polyangiaceae bacterium]
MAAFEDEVIDRLYVLNAERAAEEQRLGGAGAKPSSKRCALGDGEETSEETTVDDSGAVGGTHSAERHCDEVSCGE